MTKRQKQPADEHRRHIWLTPSVRPVRYAERNAAAINYIPSHLSVVDGIAEDIRQGWARPLHLNSRDTTPRPSAQAQIADRTIKMGLAASDSDAVSQVADMYSLTQMVGAIGHRAIREALHATELSSIDDWLSVMWGYHDDIRGYAGVTGRMIVTTPGGDSRSLVTPIDYLTIESWDDQYRGYRFEAFGRIPRSQAEVDQSPPEAHWARSIDGPSTLNGTGRYGMIVYRARVFHPDSPVYGQADWRPGWAKVLYTTPSDDLDDLTANRIAANGLRLYRGILKKAGRPEVTRDDKIDRLARFGLKWLSGHPYHTINDVGRRQIAETMGDDTTSRVDKLMEKRPGDRSGIVIADIHKRMQEIHASSDS